jgi:hypothetical protein
MRLVGSKYAVDVKYSLSASQRVAPWIGVPPIVSIDVSCRDAEGDT